MRKAYVLKWFLGLFVLTGVFSAGVFAADGIERIEATLRPDYQLKLDDETVELDQSPIVVEGSTYLPVRAIADLLDVQIGWNGTNKTIYITSPKPSEDPPRTEPSQSGSVTDSDGHDNTSSKPEVNYPRNTVLAGEIKLKSLINYNIHYLGEEYPMVANSIDNAIYFRVKDLQKLDIPLGGLKVYKDEYTGDLYMQSIELDGRWEEQPGFDLYDKPVITGEDNEEKLKFLRKHRPGYSVNGFSLSDRVCYSIDKLPDKDNTFLYLCQFAGADLYGYEVTLKYNSASEAWYASKTKSIHYGNLDELEDDEDDDDDD